jgi:hypothetical protein
MNNNRGRKKWLWRFWLPVAVLALLAAVIGKGFLGLIPKWLEIQCAPRRTFSSTSSMQNLKAVGTALSIYLETNDCYPPKDRWVDELEKYMHTADMDDSETRKKLRAPEYENTTDKYGFALNGQLSSKSKSEIKDPEKTPCIYDSTKTERNAYDDSPLESLPDPPRANGNAAVYADGHAGPVSKK